MDSSHWLKQTLDESLEKSLLEIHRFRLEKIATHMSEFDLLIKLIYHQLIHLLHQLLYVFKKEMVYIKKY